MRALVLDGTGFSRLGVRLVPTPRPGPQRMLARVDAAAICTSLIKLNEQGPNHPLLFVWDWDDLRTWYAVTRGSTVRESGSTGPEASGFSPT